MLLRSVRRHGLPAETSLGSRGNSTVHSDCGVTAAQFAPLGRSARDSAERHGPVVVLLDDFDIGCMRRRIPRRAWVFGGHYRWRSFDVVLDLRRGVDAGLGSLEPTLGQGKAWQHPKGVGGHFDTKVVDRCSSGKRFRGGAGRKSASFGRTLGRLSKLISLPLRVVRLGQHLPRHFLRHAACCGWISFRHQWRLDGFQLGHLFRHLALVDWGYAIGPGATLPGRCGHIRPHLVRKEGQNTEAQRQMPGEGFGGARTIASN
mmetsp:Transcript_55660/g.118547  ORF Transcript_55660/g.118547 Transcript_55660/m.118547 type:complete len:260 (+) Transcript_55660:292-1071(+)